jgi:prepilin-type N-terminal cleavage/methylation domain-containing protein
VAHVTVLKNSGRNRLPHGLGSVNGCERWPPILSHARQQVVLFVFRCRRLPVSQEVSPGVATRHAGVRAPRQSGVTLLEMLIVVTLIALVAGISYPSVASGVDTLRLRSASDAMVAFLNTSLDRADRRQQAVEIRISPRENMLTARSADNGFARELHLPENISIVNPNEPRRFLLYPGGSVPAIQVEVAIRGGRRRRVSVDPMTGVSRSEALQ